MKHRKSVNGVNPPLPPAYLPAGIMLAAVLALSACTELGEAKKAADGNLPDIDAFSITPAAMALFADGGEKRLNAVLPEEAAGLVTVEWEIDNEEVAEIEADEEAVVVYPKAAGSAVITAKIKPKYEGQVLNMAITEASSLLTVLTEFSLDNQHLLFFEGEPAQTVTALLPESILEVAKITWTVETARKDSITVQSSGASARVSANGLESLGIITARLEAIDAAAFNGTGRSAVCVATTLEAPFINVPASTFMLSEEQAARTATITANYGPARIDLYGPAVTWTSNDPSILRFEAGSWASLGRATAPLVAEAAGQAEVAAELTVAGRTVRETAPVTVTAYVPPTSPATSLALDKKPASVIKTDTTELITAALSTSSGMPPSDPVIEWSFSPDGYVLLIDDEDPHHKQKVRLRGAGEVTTAQQVTVTARSRSNSAVEDSFAITVNPLRVTVTGSTALVKGGTAVLNAAVNVSETGNKAIQEWTSNRLDLVTITPSETGNTTASVAIKEGAVVTSPIAIQVTAAAAADNGVTAGSINITLSPHTFKINYYKNDGTDVKLENATYTYGNTTQKIHTISAMNWVRADYAFKGWTLTENNASIYAAFGNGAAITAFNDVAAAKTPGGTVNLYAKWRHGNYPMPNVYNPQTWEDAVDLINSKGPGTADNVKTYTVPITGSFTLEPLGTPHNPVIEPKYISVTLLGSGQTMTLTGQGHLLNVYDGQTLTVQNVKLVGNTSNNTGVVHVNPRFYDGNYGPYAALVLSGSSEISGNSGGGVYASGGTVTMNGTASIKNNSSAEGGGGIGPGPETVTMNDDSVIEDNHALNSGGGIFGNFFSIPTIYMNGNAVIRNNTAGYDGGGIGLYLGSVYMTGHASIYGNSTSVHIDSKHGGGGIATKRGISMKDSASIHHNTALQGGGGGIITDSSVTMEGASSIYENQAITGGGVKGSVNMSGTSVIHTNTATGDGGGVYGGVTMLGTSMIHTNTAASKGGGIYGAVNMKENSVIHTNTAGIFGGGMWANGNSIISGSAEFRGNAADDSGGGIYLNVGGQVTLLGNIKIYNNSAKGNGAGICTHNRIQMAGCDIYNNTITGQVKSQIFVMGVMGDLDVVKYGTATLADDGQVVFEVIGNVQRPCHPNVRVVNGVITYY
ncbi:MAG: hypothetical protein LBD20_07715 [Spirochaetaceae bacterium]|jgi:hypothetical protein|nr:hypothetical protein [Spirochaetaceae bacterium]